MNALRIDDPQRRDRLALMLRRSWAPLAKVSEWTGN